MPSSDDYARAVIAEGIRRDITPRGIQIGLATVLVEAAQGNIIYMWANKKVAQSLNIPHDKVGDDGYSVGIFQQQVVWNPDVKAWWWADCATCMDPTKSAGLFFARLAKLNYNDTSKSPGSFAQSVQSSAFPDRYDQRFSDAVALYNRLTVGGKLVDKADFNEFAIWSPNNQSRNGVKVDLFVLHTQEGGGGDSAAENLAKYLANPASEVSYHYTVSQASDGGVTVVDCVDTDYASWSVLDANNRSINLCFAGSSASWTRDQWLKQSKAIEAAAYLCAADCVKYGIKPVVISPPYASDPPGISDHRYVTKRLKVGTHTDVGDGFPWPEFTAAVAKWFAVLTGTTVPTTPTTPVERVLPRDFTDRELMEDIWEQLRGPGAKGWPQLGKNEKGQNLSLVDAVAKLLGAK